MVRRIGLMTSGGDAPGMNAAIRAVVRHALGRSLEVVGIRRGYAGLLVGELLPLTRAGVANIIQRGGTILVGGIRVDPRDEKAGKLLIAITQEVEK